MKSSRPKVEPIHQPTLFQMEKSEKAAELTSQLKIERPYSLPGILLGTFVKENRDGGEGGILALVHADVCS